MTRVVEFACFECLPQMFVCLLKKLLPWSVATYNHIGASRSSQGNGEAIAKNCRVCLNGVCLCVCVFAKFDGKCLWEKPPLVCIAGQDMPEGPLVCLCISRNLHSTLESVPTNDFTCFC